MNKIKCLKLRCYLVYMTVIRNKHLIPVYFLVLASGLTFFISGFGSGYVLSEVYFSPTITPNIVNTMFTVMGGIGGFGALIFAMWAWKNWKGQEHKKYMMQKNMESLIKFREFMTRLNAEIYLMLQHYEVGNPLVAHSYKRAVKIYDKMLEPYVLIRHYKYSPSCPIGKYYEACQSIMTAVNNVVYYTRDFDEANGAREKTKNRVLKFDFVNTFVGETDKPIFMLITEFRTVSLGASQRISEQMRKGA